MVDTLIILSLLNIVSYCEGQLPINGRFTDRFGKSVDDQFRILTGETTRRILNQFQTRATVKDQTHILDSRLNNMGSDLVPTDAQSLFSFIQSELGRLGISNTDFNSNLQSGVFTGKNLGNFGSTDFLQGQNEVTPVWGNIKHVSVPSTIEPQVSNKERLRNKIIDFNTGGHRHTIVNGWSGNKSDHDQLFERENNQSSQEKRTIYNSEGQVQLPFNFNLNTVSQGNIGERALSEADLLQMGTDELAAVAKNKIDFNSEQSSHSNLPSGLGKHAMSLNSIVDVNMHQPPSDLYTSNSSTEERLILALLERLVELKENRLQRQSAVLRNENDISSRLAPIRDESISSRGSTVVSPGWHGSVQSSFCHYSGCPTTYYCVTIASSDLFADFCPADSLEPCQCAPGCNFQNRFLPENAVERVGRCRKCFCEHGEIFCQFTRRCRTLYRQASKSGRSIFPQDFI